MRPDLPDDYTDPANLAARTAIHRYGTNPVPWWGWIRERIPLTSGERVLDAGAGSGALWDFDHGVRLTLLDYSPAMRHDVRGDVAALPFRDGAFDGAVCTHVLYHLERPDDGLRELARVVRPGGWVVVTTNGLGHMAGLGLGVHDNFPAERLGEAMERHFDGVALHPYRDTLVAPVEAVRAYVASVGVDPATIPDGEPLKIEKHTVLAVATRRS